MKTMILMIVFSIMTMSLMSQVGLHSSIESGYENRQVTVEGNGIYTMNNSLYSTLNFSASLKGLALYSSTKTFFKPLRSIYGSPKQIEFYIGATYNIKKFQLGLEHLCSHSIDNDTFYDSYDRVFVKYTILE
jgi:hypothetical protein